MQILKFFPNHIINILEQYSIYLNYNLEEIRFRNGQPIILNLSSQDIVLDYRSTFNDLIEILQKICKNSVYSYQNQICNGYITVSGGHRVGITGSVVINDDKIININNISSLNFRVARQILGCGNELLKYIVNLDEDTIYNTLIISPPGAGKTTILRDCIKQLSNGIGIFNGKNIGVVDERNEIAAMYKGEPQNDIGIRTDVLENVSKSIGMKMLIRSMAPDIICADEIGSIEDIEAIKYIVCSGVKGIFTAHGSSLEEIRNNQSLNQLLDLNIFERIVFLDKNFRGNIKNIYELKNGTYVNLIYNSR